MNQPLRPVTPAIPFSESPCSYRAMWAAAGEADIRTVVDTAHLTGGNAFGTILKTVGA